MSVRILDCVCACVCVCTACDCESLGVATSDPTTCNRDSGQCQCKLNVAGRRCDVCIDGYFGLMTSQPPGTCRRQLQPVACLQS